MATLEEKRKVTQSDRVQWQKGRVLMFRLNVRLPNKRMENFFSVQSQHSWAVKSTVARATNLSALV